MSNNKRTPSNGSRKADNSTTSSVLDEMRAHPHFEVTLTPRTNMDTIIDTLLEACSGLFPGERPTIHLDTRQCLALISVSEHQVERLQYKSWIEHRPSGTRYPCRFREGTLGVPQKRVSVPLLGAKFAFLKSQQHVRDHLKKSEPLIRANWQQCTGAEYCYVHLHYSSEEPDLLAAVDELRIFLDFEAQKVLLASLPLHVPPCDRFTLSIDSGFRKVAYDHNVSPWTRTQRDSPLGPEWCTFATDTIEKMTATIEAYKEFARMNPQFNLKVLVQGENSMKTNAKSQPGRASRKSNRANGSGSSSPVAPSSPSSTNTPLEMEIPMSPVMHFQGPHQSSAHVPTISAQYSHSNNNNNKRQTHQQPQPQMTGFGPRRERGVPARSIASNDHASVQYSPPSPTPLVNANLPSDLPPGLNLASMHIIPNPPMSLPSFGFAPSTFQSLLTGLEPLRFPVNPFPTQLSESSYSNNPFMTTNSADDVWGKYSPPTESFIPSIASINSNTNVNPNNGGSNASLSYSDFFINSTDEHRILSLTDSTGLSD